MKSEFKIGSVVLSIAGHDKGNHFIVTEVVNEDYVKIVDGKVRKLATPKLKKIKHLKLTSIELNDLAKALIDGEKIFDITIKSALDKSLE